MATKNASNILEDVNFAGKRMRWALSSGGSFDFQQGDLLWYDSTAKYVKPLDSDAHAQYLIGVAEKPAFIAPYSSTQGSSGVALQKNYDQDALVMFGCLAGLYGVSGDTYHDGDQVYWGGVDAQTITNTKGGNNNVIGVIKFPSAAMGTAQAYAAGTRYPVWVFAQYPFLMS